MARPPEVVYTWSDITKDFKLSVEGKIMRVNQSKFIGI